MNHEAHVFISLWQQMLAENDRELRYTASMAGISYSLTRTLEGLGFKLFGYNESYESFFAEVF